MASSDKCPCGLCRKNINLRRSKALKCDGECKKTYHIECVEISDQKYNEIIANDASFWFCKNCHQKKVSQRTSIYGTSSANTNTPTTSTKQLAEEITLTTLNNKINKILQRQDEYFNELNHLNIVMEDYKKITDDVVQTNQAIMVENEHLKNEILKINHKYDNIEQKELNQNILLNGIEMHPNEKRS